MPNKSYQQNKRRLASLAKKKVKRNRIQKHKRYLTFLDKKFPRCELCGTRNKFNIQCVNYPHNAEEKEEMENALRIQEGR